MDCFFFKSFSLLGLFWHTWPHFRGNILALSLAQTESYERCLFLLQFGRIFFLSKGLSFGSQATFQAPFKIVRYWQYLGHRQRLMRVLCRNLGDFLFLRGLVIFFRQSTQFLIEGFQPKSENIWWNIWKEIFVFLNLKHFLHFAGYILAGPHCQRVCDRCLRIRPDLRVYLWLFISYASSSTLYTSRQSVTWSF